MPNLESSIPMLVLAARHVEAVIHPELTDGPDGPLIHLGERDLQALRRAADNGPLGAAATRLRQLVTPRGHMRNLALTGDAARALTNALVDLDHAIDRDRKVRSGTYTGPMSSREAMQYTIARARRGLR